MSRILVTGSEGTIGSKLTQELKRRGHDVWGCDLQHQPSPFFVRADVADYRQMERVFQEVKPEYVYHLAAEFGRLNGEKFYETLWRTNAIGTRNILECQKHLGFRLIFASSSEIYGERVDALPLREELSETEALFQMNEYALTKWVNEVQIRNFAQRHGIEAMRLRFFNAYGPGEFYHPYRSVVCLFCYRALMGLPYTVYRGYWRVFMYIDDFIPTVANACERFVPGAVYNIGGVEFRSVEDLSTLVLAHSGGDSALVSYLDQDVHNVQSKRPDISRARLHLGHNPQIELEEGVEATMCWMREIYLGGGGRNAESLQVASHPMPRG